MLFISELSESSVPFSKYEGMSNVFMHNFIAYMTNSSDIGLAVTTFDYSFRKGPLRFSWAGDGRKNFNHIEILSYSCTFALMFETVSQREEKKEFC